jgi:hypothetical protein
MDYAQYVALPGIVSGDRWQGINSIGPVTIDSAQPAVALARVRMQFRLGAEVFKLDSDAAQNPDAPITITNAATWTATIPGIETGFLNTAGKWVFDIEFYGTGQGAETYIKGDIEIYPHVTE